MMKKAKFVGLALLLAFALMGAAFAAWSDTLTANGTVNTGELDATISVTDTTENESSDGPDVASVNAIATEDGKGLNITLSNAYPGYSATVNFKVKNTGTIPVKVSKLTLTPGTGNPDGEVTYTVNFPGTGGGTLAPDGELSGTITFTVGEGADENGTYNFSGTISVTQFNK